MPNRLTRWIIVGLVLGIVGGYVAYAYFPESSARFAGVVSLLPTIFLRLIKMIIAPLVFSTLVVGIAKMGDIATVGRVGGKALGWFIGASLVSLVLGLVLGAVVDEGRGHEQQLEPVRVLERVEEQQDHVPVDGRELALELADDDGILLERFHRDVDVLLVIEDPELRPLGRGRPGKNAYPAGRSRASAAIPLPLVVRPAV